MKEVVDREFIGILRDVDVTTALLAKQTSHYHPLNSVQT
jgi:hypothetical protein